MKLKKGVKRFLIAVVIILVAVSAFLVFKNLDSKQDTKEVKVVSKISEYGYTLKDSKTKAYKDMFKDLKEILQKDKVDEEAYVKQISKMFIYDFYSLNDKAAKTDVGGTDFVYTEILDNFLLNAQDTYYKYVESNIYNDRKQSLPIVDETSIKIDDINSAAYAYGTKTDEKAYAVKVTWNYTDDEYSDYQKEATLVFIHDGKKLSLVELQ